MKVRSKLKANKSEIRRCSSVLKAREHGFSHGQNLPANRIFNLQRTIGNHTVQRLIKSGGIQAKLKIGLPNDKYEKEADRVAEQVLSMSEPQVQLSDQNSPLVQRQIELEEKEDEEEPLMTKSISKNTQKGQDNFRNRLNLNRYSGHALHDTNRDFMEGRFGVDLSAVRVHTDSNAVQMNRELNAEAFTYGEHIYFGAGRYNPATSTGKKLLGHELTHVVQQKNDLQRAGTPSSKVLASRPLRDSKVLKKSLDGEKNHIMAYQTGIVKPGELASLSPQIQLYQSKICKRRSTQFKDFPKTYISEINIDLTSPNHSVTLIWIGPNKSRGPKGPFHSSPGAGRCGLDCNDAATSRKNESLCTPKGTNKVEKYRCIMPGHPSAKNVTYFHWGRRIALHYFPSRPKYPASHGCVRLPLHASRLIYDNSRKNLTTVKVSGTWKGKICYDKKDRRRRRKGK